MLKPGAQIIVGLPARPQQLTFMVPLYSPMPPQYFVKVLSDRWINSSAVLPISFRHLILPARFPHPSELLDRLPIPISNLKWPLVEEKLFKPRGISTLNAIQTQLFQTVFNSDESFLLGAPSGSGKSLLAELAILRMVQKGDSGKWVYLAPLQTLVDVSLLLFPD